MEVPLDLRFSRWEVLATDEGLRTSCGLLLTKICPITQTRRLDEIVEPLARFHRWARKAVPARSCSLRRIGDCLSVEVDDAEAHAGSDASVRGRMRFHHSTIAAGSVVASWSPCPPLSAGTRPARVSKARPELTGVSIEDREGTQRTSRKRRSNQRALLTVSQIIHAVMVRIPQRPHPPPIWIR
jgi:hypothetical protein